MTNEAIAQRLWLEARRLDQREHLYRVRAYRRAAEAISFLRVPLIELFREGGRPALERLPGIGTSLARSIALLIRTGEWRAEEKLRYAS